MYFLEFILFFFCKVRIIYKTFELDGNLTVIDWVMAESDNINNKQNNNLKNFNPKSVREE